MRLRLILAAVCAVAIAACSSSNDAQRALNGAGYTNINITGYRWTGCSESDEFSTGFEATGPSGVRTSGVVCSHWFKGSTIRTD